MDNISLLNNAIEYESFLFFLNLSLILCDTEIWFGAVSVATTAEKDASQKYIHPTGEKMNC